MEEMQPKLLDLIPNERGWGVTANDREMVIGGGFGVREEKKLELRLGLPGEEDWNANRKKTEGLCANVKPSFSLGLFGAPQTKQEAGLVTGEAQKIQAKADKQTSIVERKAIAHAATPPAATPLPSNSRAANAPVVGWPPVRSFRRNLASTSKTVLKPQKWASGTCAKFENSTKGLFVKINMDGVPIGRKIDLKAYDSYDKLSSAVDQLFRGLLADQRSEIGTEKNVEEKGRAIQGLLDGSGEYTLVYEDDEGDKMLVGDVPWEMFVSTAKRLRVLKSSDLSASTLRTTSRKRAATEC
ncbi:Auxin-responsive protein [Rhynchospora pubera]|uniref:Auxin-responsive protein n=1 Tax=Rhynchospora pubera TaxID=906938 RepID=A0AAV8FTL9_9POAL|nr:Auxin-responsive protein [Rhynchospora pubera]